MARDAGALLANRLFRDLDQNLLPFFQQIADQGNRRRLTPAETASAPSSSAPAAAITSLVTRALPSLWCPLGISGGRGRANLGTGIYGSVPARFGVQHRFRFGLGFLEFRVFAVLFWRRTFSRQLAGLRSSFQVNLRNGVPRVPHQVGAIGSLGFFLEFLVALVRRRLVVDGVRFLVFDGLFFHGSGGGKCGSLLVVQVLRN